MSASIFLPRPSKFSVYFEEACKEFYSSRIDGDNLVTPDLISQIKPNLTFGELVKGIQPDRKSSFVDNGEIVLCNSASKILYKMQIEKLVF